MPRVKQTKPTESDKVVAPVVVAAAPVTKKSTKTPKTDAPVVEVAAVAPTVVETSAADVSKEVVTECDNSLFEASADFIAKLQQVTSIMASLKSEYRLLEKKWTRELKIAQKSSSKRKRRVGNRAPSGFVKPTLISDELAQFLDKPSGSEMARTEVTRDINKYIRAHNLQDVTNGRKIIPDAKLSALLKIGATDELTYFNLQRYMSPHFAKSVKADASAKAETSV
jgi:upstream activation factor subunit UAF30